jgi:N-acetylornithine carbamoyltransferase
MDEHFGGAAAGRRFVLSWAPHPSPLPRAVPNSALLMAARSGMHVVVARPAGFELEPDVMALAQETAQRAGGSVTETDRQAEAIAGADVVYAKAWAGQAVYSDRTGEASRRASLAAWRITAERMASTNDGRFMHCLPVRRGVVVDDEVLDGPSTIHRLQAEYRLHAQKAILEWIWDLLPNP